MGKKLSGLFQLLIIESSIQSGLNKKGCFGVGLVSGVAWLIQKLCVLPILQLLIPWIRSVLLLTVLLDECYHLCWSATALDLPSQISTSRKLMWSTDSDCSIPESFLTRNDRMWIVSPCQVFHFCFMWIQPHTFIRFIYLWRKSKTTTKCWEPIYHEI